MKLKQFILCAAAIVLPLSANAASKKNKDRWFEIEVILFSQLGDKSALKESFPEHSELPKYRRSLDLLANYLNPDIASLKQLLPSCESPYYAANLVSQNAKLPALFTEKSLAEIAQIPALTAQSSTSFDELNNAADSFSDGTELLPTEAEKPLSITDSQNNSLQDNEQQNVELQNNHLQPSLATELSSELSAEERTEIAALVIAAENEFSHFKFPYTVEQVTDKSAESWCRIDKQQLTSQQSDNDDFDYYGFTVDKMPLAINAAEDINNTKSHLLSKESLKLGDVITDLRYSKNFRPILHMGWRQVARPKKQSIPVKVYAGDNFAADYEKQLTTFQTQQNALMSQAAINETLAAASGQQPKTDSLTERNAALLAQAKQTRIADIVSQISAITDDTDTLLNTIESDDLSLQLDDETNVNVEQNIAPIAPVQDWFIDGLFNVHLKHYLFITADFNVLDKNLAELATARLSDASPAINNTNSQNSRDALPTQAKAIRFKQNRRVISGEVHYFDHPYMGMIVQIRPYKKPKEETNN